VDWLDLIRVNPYIQIMTSKNSSLTSFHSSAAALARAGSEVLALPFDMAAESYVRAVRAGLIERSMLRSARFRRTLRQLEKLSLGIWARKF
jgi:hypothetical protein